MRGAYCRQPANEVLVVHHRPELATNLIFMLERLGHRVRIACTALEAVWLLERHAPSIHSAVVARVFGDRDGRDIVRFLSTSYPRVRRVLLVSDPTEPLHAPDGRAHAVIRGPCDLSGLQRALPEPGRVRPPAITA